MLMIEVVLFLLSQNTFYFACTFHQANLKNRFTEHHHYHGAQQMNSFGAKDKVNGWSGINSTLFSEQKEVYLFPQCLFSKP